MGNGFCVRRGKTARLFLFYFRVTTLVKFRLVYYRYPTDMELRKLAGLPIPKAKPKPKEGEHKRGKLKKKREEPVEDKTFNVPKNIDIQVTAFV